MLVRLVVDKSKTLSNERVKSRVMEVQSQVQKFELVLQYTVVVKNTKKSGILVHVPQNLKQKIIKNYCEIVQTWNEVVRQCTLTSLQDAAH